MDNIEQRQQQNKSEVIIKNLNTVKIEGVTKVISASNKEVVVQINGAKTIIGGTELFVNKLLLEQKVVEITGNVALIKFNQTATTRPNFFKRIFS